MPFVSGQNHTLLICVYSRPTYIVSFFVDLQVARVCCTSRQEYEYWSVVCHDTNLARTLKFLYKDIMHKFELTFKLQSCIITVILITASISSFCNISTNYFRKIIVNEFNVIRRTIVSLRLRFEHSNHTVSFCSFHHIVETVWSWKNTVKREIRFHYSVLWLLPPTVNVIA